MDKKIRNDIILFSAILLVAAIVFLLISFFASDGSILEISIDGKVQGYYSLYENQTVELGTNTFVIEDGFANMISATCPDGLCVLQRKISNVGESIVCLPNRVILTIVGDSEIDTIVR